MPLEFKQTSVNFDSTTNKKQREPGSVNFSHNVRTAECVLKGFNVRFTNGEHPLHEIEIDIDDVNPDGTQVTFFVDFGLRDDSGHFDDAYKGWVQVIVIADTV
jgi:hypothetical protein